MHFPLTGGASLSCKALAERSRGLLWMEQEQEPLEKRDAKSGRQMASPVQAGPHLGSRDGQACLGHVLSGTLPGCGSWGQLGDMGSSQSARRGPPLPGLSSFQLHDLSSRDLPRCPVPKSVSCGAGQANNLPRLPGGKGRLEGPLERSPNGTRRRRSPCSALRPGWWALLTTQQPQQRPRSRQGPPCQESSLRVLPHSQTATPVSGPPSPNRDGPSQPAWTPGPATPPGGPASHGRQVSVFRVPSEAYGSGRP